MAIRSFVDDVTQSKHYVICKPIKFSEIKGVDDELKKDYSERPVSVDFDANGNAINEWHDAALKALLLFMNVDAGRITTLQFKSKGGSTTFTVKRSLTGVWGDEVDYATPINETVTDGNSSLVDLNTNEKAVYIHITAVPSGGASYCAMMSN